MNRRFHGRTIAALSITSSNLSYKKGLTSSLSNIFVMIFLKNH
jgi:acetylornithine/succinyldiaminopimelate/putrescine aminotransferase